MRRRLASCSMTTRVTIPIGKRKPCQGVIKWGFPVSKQPQTVGEHLKKEKIWFRYSPGEAAYMLRVGQLTLGLWERDKVYPGRPPLNSLL
jgi:hypothetical protein